MFSEKFRDTGLGHRKDHYKVTESSAIMGINGVIKSWGNATPTKLGTLTNVKVEASIYGANFHLIPLQFQ